MRRPSVRRARSATGELAPGWVVIWPAYGFSSSTTSRRDRWREASRRDRWREALATVTGPASAGPIVERQTAGYLPGLYSGRGSARRPRWIEASA